MNQTVKERLILFIRSLNISQAKFEKQCGFANGYVNNIRKSITTDKLQQIALNYPELNKGWLLTGEGEMLKSNEAPEPKPQLSAKAEGLVEKLITSMEAAMASMQTTIDTQKQIIESQKAEIERLQRALEERG